MALTHEELKDSSDKLALKYSKKGAIRLLLMFIATAKGDDVAREAVRASLASEALTWPDAEGGDA